MNTVQALLQVSAKLYQHLTTLPSENERDVFIKKIHQHLDERGLLIDQLQHEGFQVDLTNKAHATLAELDKGIQTRLDSSDESHSSRFKEFTKCEKK